MKAFRGLNNVTDPMRLGLDWLVQADNVDVTETGALRARLGYSQAMAGTAIAGAYATCDLERMYFVDNGVLKAMDSASTAHAIASGLSAGAMHWTEINGQVFYTNGIDSGIINPDHECLPWAWSVPQSPNLLATTGQLPAGQYGVRIAHRMPDGRITGAGDAEWVTLNGEQALQIVPVTPPAGYVAEVYICPADSTVFQFAGTGSMVWNHSADALGLELPSMDEPLPDGCGPIVAHRGRIHAAKYLAEHGQSVVWSSNPLGFHLFDLTRDYIMVPGEVLMLASVTAGMVIGTADRIFAYDGQSLAQLADYGVVPGQHWDLENPGSGLFWSKRGLCRALPFANLTERQVSVAPGVRAGGAIVRRQGRESYIVSIQQGGSAFNPF